LAEKKRDFSPPPSKERRKGKKRGEAPLFTPLIGTIRIQVTFQVGFIKPWLVLSLF
jgi:hypothetical protein